MTSTEACALDRGTQLSALLAAIRMEGWSRDFYRRISECVADDASRIILNSLADDEEMHRASLENEVKRLSTDIDLTAIAPNERYTNIVPSEPFPLPPPGICLNLKDEVKVLEEAVRTEERKGSLFKEIVEGTEDCQLKETIGALRARNLEHRKALEEDLFYLKRGGSWYGYTPILDG